MFFGQQNGFLLILQATTIHIHSTMSSSVSDNRLTYITQEAMTAEWEEVQAAQLDARAFKPLYERYYEPIFRFVWRRCEDEHTAADICSQVFLKALSKLSGYQFKGVPFSAWLYRIASNEVVMYFRQQQRQRVVSADTAIYADLADPDALQALADSDRDLLERQIASLLQSLKPEELTIIELRFFEHRPFAEIAQILDISEANAKMRTYRILDKLRKKMPKP